MAALPYSLIMVTMERKETHLGYDDGGYVFVIFSSETVFFIFYIYFVFYLYVSGLCMFRFCFIFFLDSLHLNNGYYAVVFIFTTFNASTFGYVCRQSI